MRLPIVAGTAFIAGCLGVALGAAPDQRPGVTGAYAAPGLKVAFANEFDCAYVQRVFTLTLTTARDGAEPATWRNARSGASGTMRIFYTTREADGVMCRRFEQTTTVNGSKVSGVGTACYKNTVWQIAA